MLLSTVSECFHQMQAGDAPAPLGQGWFDMRKPLPDLCWHSCLGRVGVFLFSSGWVSISQPLVFKWYLYFDADALPQWNHSFSTAESYWFTFSWELILKEIELQYLELLLESLLVGNSGKWGKRTVFLISMEKTKFFASFWSTHLLEISFYHSWVSSLL